MINNINSTADLRNAIQLLEVEQTNNGVLLKEQFHQTYERFKPGNLLRHAMRDVLETPHLTDDVLGATVGLAAGYLTRKIVVGKSDDDLRNLVGKILGNWVANFVAQHPEALKAIGRYICSFFSTKEEVESDDQ